MKEASEGDGYLIQRASTGNTELDSFLSGGFPRGSLILVSGNPGTGKTIFTASFLYEGATVEKENGIYFSFSESRQSFFENMKTLGFDFEAAEREGHFAFIEMVTTTREGVGKMAGDMLEAIRKFGAKRLVIDSYSVLAQTIGDRHEGRQVLHTILGKVGRNLGCTTLIIGEQPTGEDRIGDGSEEFVADGVLNMKLTIPRELEIRKMRGTKLKTREVIYTIDNGFRVLTTELRKPTTPKKWVPIQDNGDLLSTGSADFDSILGGGFPKGAYVILESSIDVRVREIRLITRAISLNFIAQKRGTMLVPTSGVTAKEIKTSYSPYITNELFEKYVRIPEQPSSAKSRRGKLPPYIIPSFSGEDWGGETELEQRAKRFDNAYRELKAKTRNQPVLRNIGLDSLEINYARYPDKLLNEVGVSIARTRGAGDLTIGIAKSTFKLLDPILGMVDWHVRLTKKNGLVMIQGVKPYTNLYAVDWDVSLGYPVPKLSILT